MNQGQVLERAINFKWDWGTITLKSAVGPQKQIAELAKQLIMQGLPPAGIICFGISKTGVDSHLVYIEPTDRISTAADIAAMCGIFSKAEVFGFLLGDHNYASFFSSMENGVMISVWDKGFKTDKYSDITYKSFCDAIFDEDGKVRGSDSTTLLLLSRQGERILCANLNGGMDQITEIMSPVNLGFPTFGVVARKIILTAQMDNNQVYAISVNKIIQTIKTGDLPRWEVRSLLVDQVEDISLPVDESGTTVVITAVKYGRRLLFPAVVLPDLTNGLRITLCIGHSVTEIQRTDPAPQRIDVAANFVVARQNNGGPNRLHITTIEKYATGNASFIAMIDRATSGDFSRAIA
jgi:hypothetical protein